MAHYHKLKPNKNLKKFMIQLQVLFNKLTKFQYVQQIFSGWNKALKWDHRKQEHEFSRTLMAHYSKLKPNKNQKKIPFEIWSTLEQIHKVSMGSKNIFCFKQSSKLGATRHRTKQFKRKKGITTYQTYLKRIIMKKKMKIIEKGSYEYAMN